MPVLMTISLPAKDYSVALLLYYEDIPAYSLQWAGQLHDLLLLIYFRSFQATFLFC